MGIVTTTFSPIRSECFDSMSIAGELTRPHRVEIDRGAAEGGHGHDGF